MTSTIPLTYASVQYHTGAPRRKVRNWLDDLVREGVLEVDSGDDGELLFEVPGAARPAGGPRTFDELQRWQGLGASVLAKKLQERYGARGAAQALARSARADLARGTGGGRKSLILSGALSLIFGPLGWLYAGSFREAVPAALIYYLIWVMMPTFLLLPVLSIALPLSGLAGVVYAWQHNTDGKRGTLLLGDGKKD